MSLATRASIDRFALALGVTLALLIAMIVASFGFALWRDRQERLTHAMETTRNLAQVIDEHSASMLKAVDLALSHATSLATLAMPNKDEHRALVRRQLLADLKALAPVRALFITDASGRMIHDTDSYPAANFNFADREYFTFQRDNPERGLFIGRPAISRTTGKWFIGISRRIETADGKFGGVAVAAVESARLDGFYGAIKVGEQGTMQLARSDGALLVRMPRGAVPLQENAAGDSLFRESPPPAANGTYRAIGPNDGVARIYTYRQLSGWPLAVLVGLGEEEVLAGWRANVRNYILVAVAVSLAVVFLAWLLWRELNRREKLALALRTSETRFRGLIELSSDWYWEQDAELRFTEISREASERAGLRAGEFIGKRRDEVGIVGIGTSEREAWLRLVQERKPFRDVAVSIPAADGSTRWCQISGTPIFDGQGGFLGYRGVGKDVSELLKAQRALIDSERHYRMLFEANPHPMWVYDFETLRFLAVNEAALLQYGYAREEFMAMTILELRPADQANAVWDSTRAAGRQHRYRSVWRHWKKSGEMFDVEIVSEGIEFAGRKARLVLALDITDRRRAEEEVQRLNVELEERVQVRTEELEAANEELEAFSYSVAHDLRAPLRHIASYAGLVNQERHAVSPMAQRSLDSILQAANTMARLIDDLLDFSRTSRASIRLAKVELQGLVEEVREECMRDASGRDIAWRIGRLPAVMADASLLRVVLVNLLSNAVKFTARRPQAAIDIGIDAPAGSPGDGTVVLYVRDNGAGFNMDYAKKLFGVFQRLHKQGEFPGTGIGLATVHRIVQRHGGRIWAESKIDRGATFFVSLKLA